MTAERLEVKVTPGIAWGQPHIRGIGTEHLAGMVWSGMTFEATVEEYSDYGVTAADVILACWWEAQPGRPFRREWDGWAEVVYPLLAAAHGGDGWVSGVVAPPRRGGVDG